MAICSIEIEVGGKKVSVSLDEARKLHKELCQFFGQGGYPAPEPTWLDPNDLLRKIGEHKKKYPGQPIYPEVWCSNQTSLKDGVKIGGGSSN